MPEANGHVPLTFIVENGVVVEFQEKVFGDEGQSVTITTIKRSVDHAGHFEYNVEHVLPRRGHARKGTLERILGDWTEHARAPYLKVFELTDPTAERIRDLGFKRFRIMYR